MSRVVLLKKDGVDCGCGEQGGGGEGEAQPPPGTEERSCGWEHRGGHGAAAPPNALLQHHTNFLRVHVSRGWRPFAMILLARFQEHFGSLWNLEV